MEIIDITDNTPDGNESDSSNSVEGWKYIYSPKSIITIVERGLLCQSILKVT